MKRLLSILLVALLLPAEGWSQATVLQGGSWSPGYVPIYSSAGGGQPVIRQSATAAGGAAGLGIKELNVTSQCASPPCASSGTGQLGTVVQYQDAPTTNASGYHAMSFGFDSTGGLIAFNAYGGAAAKPLRVNLNGSYYSFPVSVGGITGPGTTVVGNIMLWNNTSGTLASDAGVGIGTSGAAVPRLDTANTWTGAQTIAGSTSFLLGGSSSGTTQVKAAATASGVITVPAATDTLMGKATTDTMTNKTFDTAGTGNSFSIAGVAVTANSGTGAVARATSPTFVTPVLGAATATSINGLTITSSTGTLSITNGKTLSSTGTLTFAGTDGSTLNIGTGGTLGTAAYTAATAYVPSNTQVSNYLSGDVTVNNTASYFTGPTVAQGVTGTWWATGTVTVGCTGGGDTWNIKLWDGTTVISSTQVRSASGNQYESPTLAGYLATPTGNLRISAQATTRTDCLILFNASGNSKDSGISAFRVN